MFVGCYEIGINVTAKQVQHVGIIWACSLPGEDLLIFLVLRWQKKLLCCGLLGVISTQADTMPNITI